MSEEEKKVDAVIVGSPPIRGRNKSHLKVILAAFAALSNMPSNMIEVRIPKKHPKVRRVPAVPYRQAKVFFAAETEKDLQALKAAEEKRARKAAKLARS